MNQFATIKERLVTPNTLRFLIVTCFTGMNLLFGMLALFSVLEGMMNVAAMYLIVCVILDAIDGGLARRWGVTSAFGSQLDSLADMTSFSIASAVLAFYWLSPSMPFALMVGASCLYVLSGAIRLARFNVSLPSTQYFQGLPTTFVAAVVATVYLTYPQLNSAWGFALVLLLAVLMVSVFPYPKFGYVRKLPLWFWLLIGCGMLLNAAWTLWMMALAYVVTGPILWLHRLYKRRWA